MPHYMPRLTEEGKYEVEVDSARLVEAATGTIGVEWMFTCEQGYIEYEMWVTPNTADRAWETLDILGFTKRHAEDLENLDRVGDICHGNRCEIVCRDDTYKGVTKLKVRFVNRLGARLAAGSTKAKLHAILNGTSVSGPAPVPASGPVPRSAPPGPASYPQNPPFRPVVPIDDPDDDVPF
jgi:hypothetical protein